MLDSVARNLYDRPTTRYVLDTLGLDIYTRSLYYRTREAYLGTVELSVGDVSVDVAATTLPENADLEPEFRVLEDVVDAFRPDDVFWDVGASKGLYTLPAHAAAPDGEVVAFEPHPVRRGELDRNLDRNDADARVREEALSDVEGEAEFDYGIVTNGTTGDLTASLATGDSLVSRGAVPVPNVVKIDIEGAEYQAVRGMHDTLSHPDCRLVYCELHSMTDRGFEGTPEAVRDEFETLGFDVSTVATRQDADWSQAYLKAETS